MEEKVIEIIELLKKEYPDVKIALDYSNPFELLIATILSAQCTDVQVNEVTNTLFKKYSTLQDYIKTPQEELEKDIHSTGFYRNKAKNIKKLCEILVSDHDSTVPDNMEDLLALPGVARKTANIVLSRGFGKIEGIAVDTHVKRVSARLGLTKNTDQDKIEKDLMRVVPKSDWDIFTLLLIQHGRKTCAAKKPLCSECVLYKLCPSALTFVVHEHDARRLHYDLRLEIGGVLRSWAIPKEPPDREGVKRLAVQTEDHPVEYADFEGTIPEGMYGAGNVRIWDKGKFTIEEEKDDRLLFELRGKRLIGRYALIKTKFKGKDSWLFFKRK